MWVLSNVFPKKQIYHKLAKTFQFPTTKMQNTLGNHEDFNRVLMGLWVKVKVKGKKYVVICGAQSQKV